MARFSQFIAQLTVSTMSVLAMAVVLLPSPLPVTTDAAYLQKATLVAGNVAAEPVDCFRVSAEPVSGT